jgi:CheY-like chemotaxis protein
MNPTATRSDKILVVDDDARIRDLLRRYLTQEGFEVMVAEDGKALSRILLRDTVDLIVLDLMMPGEDGLSICRRLRAANDRTPIIMLTAKGEDVDRIVGLEVGMPCFAVARHSRPPVRPPLTAKWSLSVLSFSIWAHARCAKTAKNCH